MRRRLFEIIEVSEDENSGDRVSAAYDAIMLLAIIISIIPLAFKQTNRFFDISGIITTWLFVVDYVLRLITCRTAGRYHYRGLS